MQADLRLPRYMRWNPFWSAFAAAAYIALLALFLRYIELVRHDTPDTILDGIAFLSLFVFSAATMAFLFFYEPVRLLVEGRKAAAASYFVKTLGIFGATTAAALTLTSLQ